MSNAPRRYSFGGLEAQGLVGRFSFAQVLVLAVGAVGALVVFATQPSAVGLVVATSFVLGTAGAALVPLGTRRLAGRSLVEWAPVAARFSLRGKVWRSDRPTSGGPVAEDLPPELADLQVLAVPFRTAEAGVTKDVLDGTYAATLAVRVPAFGLLDGTEQERRQEAWGAVLAEAAGTGSTVTRIAWIERTVPSTGDGLGTYLRDARDATVALDTPAVQSYLELLGAETDAVQRHEVLVTVKVDPARDKDMRTLYGAGDEGAAALLLTEVQQLADALVRAQVEIVGVLSPKALGRALRTGLDPWSVDHLERLETEDPERDGVDPENAGPLAREELWDRVRTDGAVHRVFWVAGWPERAVGAGFLSPLLLQSSRTRTVAMVFEPVPTRRALRDAEAAVVEDESNRELRRRHGFLTKQRTRRREESNERRELELSVGHSEVRFTAFVAVHARDDDELRDATREVENRAARCHLELRPMFGQQPDALTFVLPLARGLR